MIAYLNIIKNRDKDTIDIIIKLIAIKPDAVDIFESNLSYNYWEILNLHYIDLSKKLLKSERFVKLINQSKNSTLEVFLISKIK